MKRFTALALLAAFAAAAAHAKIVTRSIDYSDEGVALQGYLAYDDEASEKGKLPGVLVVHEWWGLNDYARHRAEQLAGLGYVAFALDMYGKGMVATDKAKAAALAGPFYGSPRMVSRSKAGLDVLLGTGLVDPDRVAAIGYCFGGSTVQALAYSGAHLAGIVSFHGGLIPVPAGAAARTRARILICQGGIDPFVKKADRDAFHQAMDAGKFDYQIIDYSGAIHAFTNPDSDRVAVLNGMQGGIGYNEAADRRSWAHMRVFFDEIFAPQGATSAR